MRRIAYDYELAARDYDLHNFEVYLDQRGVQSEGRGRARKWFCIWHDDTSTPNANLFDGGDGKVWLFCHACGAHGDILDVAAHFEDHALLDRYVLTDRQQPQRRPVARSKPKVEAEVVPVDTRKQWAHDLDDARYALQWTERKISMETIKALNLRVLKAGPHAGRLLVPFFDAEGEITTLTSRSVDGSKPKYRNEAGAHQLLYWTPAALRAERGSTLVLTEGQSDAIAAYDCGFAAVAVCGATSFNAALAATLRGYKVLIVGDGDDAGTMFAQGADALLSAAFVERRWCTAPEGDDIAELHLMGEAKAWLRGQCALPFTTPWKHLNRITADTDMPAVKWLIDGWVPGMGVGIIYGESETYKSWLGCTLAQAVSLGTPWLGKMVTETGPAVILDWENTQNDLVDRQFKLNVDSNSMLHWMHLGSASLYDPEVVDEITVFLESVQPRFVFFDSLSRAFDGLEENAAGETNQALKLLMTMCDEINAAGLVLHHANKPWRDGTAGFKTRMRGSTALVNAAQYAMYAQKGPKGEAYLHWAKQRSGIKPLPLEFELWDTPDGKVRLEHIRTLKHPTP
jgi:hypothetical protein